jgi:hypothetical protein
MAIRASFFSDLGIPYGDRQAAYAKLVGTVEFRAAVNNLARRLRSPEGGTLLQIVAHMALSGIVRKSAVLTGRSRASWYPAFSRVCQSLRVPVPFGSDFTADELLGTTEGTYYENLTGAQKMIRFASSTPYIRLLEYGYSTKAPWGMVRITMQELTGTIPKPLQREIKRIIGRSPFGKFATWRGGRGGYKDVSESEQSPVGSMDLIGSID